MNFLKPSITKVFFVILSTCLLFFCLSSRFNILIHPINETILLTLIIIYIVPVFVAASLTSLITGIFFPSLQKTGTPMPGYNFFSINEPTGITFLIILIPCLYLWICVLVSIIKLIISSRKQYIYEKKFKKNRPSSL